MIGVRETRAVEKQGAQVVAEGQRRPPNSCKPAGSTTAAVGHAALHHPDVSPTDRVRAIALSLLSAVLAALLFWTAALAGLGWWASLLGVIVGLSLLGLFPRRRRHPIPVGFMAGFWFAFALLAFPIGWIVVGSIRYLITGETLGQ
ncbi:MAG TPA: hypothetical protein VNZ05_09720 [Solirubrobacteraceae bacterium]|nr:hypothetical protein [Solirubrobacteraceae bacterium]